MCDINLFVMQISRNLFVIYFHKTFHKTLRYRLPRALEMLVNTLNYNAKEGSREHKKV